MPLIRIERRTKPASQGAPRAASAESRPAGGGSPLPALLAGAVSALAVLGGIAWFLIGRTAAPAATAPAGAAPGGQAAAPAPVEVPAVGFPPAQLTHVPVLNPDFPRDAVIAVVAGTPITMAQLEARVRVARTLGTLAGDPVPGYDDPRGLREFQVQMLRRSVDVVLIQQAAQAAGVAVPPGGSSDAVTSFLQRVNAAPEQLEDAMASNGVTQPMLDAWFASATLIDFYVQSEILAGRDAAEREAAVKEWLDARWATEAIDIAFYDPEEL